MFLGIIFEKYFFTKVPEGNKKYIQSRETSVMNSIVIYHTCSKVTNS